MNGFSNRYRFHAVLFFLFLLTLAVASRLVYLRVHDSEFLIDQGERRSVRHIPIPVTRGLITDRNGSPLAVSTEVSTIWCNPSEMKESMDRVPALAAALHRPADELMSYIKARSEKHFLYLARGLSPIEGEDIMALDIKGVHQLKEYKRYYPTSDLTAQLIGLVNLDGEGQEGVELGYNEWLSGKAGVREVLINPRGSIVKNIKVDKQPKPSQDIALSIDLRLQFEAYRALQEAVTKFGALSGSAVLVNPKNGQILAMANFPSYNPNNRASINPTFMRNRALTDVFEPGSVIKPFSMSAALATGKFNENTQVSVAPGWFVIDGHTIRDVARRDILTMTGVLINSSNIGMSKVALEVGPKPILEQLARVGFGSPLSLGFPGENAGYLPNHVKWSRIATASMSYGYSLAVNTAELAQAYTVFANDGKLAPLSLLRDNPQQLVPAMDPQVAHRIRMMLKEVVEDPSGVVRARVPGYQVAGKSGTARRSGGGGYKEHAYRSMFVGMAPASDPKLVLAVMMDSPTKIGYYGGLVSAPVFSQIMSGALRALAIPPDNLPPTNTAQSETPAPHSHT
ncbi:MULTISPECIES: penicillin-binding protein 2 [Pseudomonas]|uniref:peptidoglycan D,D-transpeptidase FtsI family protein n=1 Tax=Pseudomonas TaxID=286 RepID=UPI00031929CC|nr:MULTISPECIES: penicillin-binding protein 2 [Pseudomonas]MBA1248639.1 penicillin-binding protein 2 [Pseudomonas zeshuii]MDN3236105.1 penicillin-binding protein 2 [Pseudomonas sp. WAC2]QEU27815.1 penicillin-binding protein 2 [Pseudomonas luteola]RRW47292.1 penicillin-binding protein 2 [Pseudomonas luteola]